MERTTYTIDSADPAAVGRTLLSEASRICDAGDLSRALAVAVLRDAAATGNLSGLYIEDAQFFRGLADLIEQDATQAGEAATP